MKYLALLLLCSAEFWETKQPADWSQAEINMLLSDSPWAQTVQAPGTGTAAPPVQVIIATAGPIEKAEAERARREPKKKTEPDPLQEEYRAWLNENRATQIVVAIPVRRAEVFSEDRELKTMQEESVMKVGRKKYKMTGFFPPTPNDPYLRMAFPREVRATDKSVIFDLYVPGVGIGYRSAEFSIKDMMVNGKLEI